MDELSADQRQRLRDERKEEVGSWVRAGCAGLRDAVVFMAGRYGQAQLRYGLTVDGRPEPISAYHERAASRRFRALQRLARQIKS